MATCIITNIKTNNYYYFGLDTLPRKLWLRGWTSIKILPMKKYISCNQTSEKQKTVVPDTVLRLLLTTGFAIEYQYLQLQIQNSYCSGGFFSHQHLWQIGVISGS